MNIMKAINSGRIERDHGDGLVEVKTFYFGAGLYAHYFEKDGKKHGKETRYLPSGDLWLYHIYHNGVVSEQHCYKG